MLVFTLLSWAGKLKHVHTIEQQQSNSEYLSRVE